MPPATASPGSVTRVTGRLTRARSGSLSLRRSAAPTVRMWRSDCLRRAAAEVWGRPLTLNVSMPIAAVLLDLGFDATTVKAIPILARTAGLLAHLAEEQQQPIGLLMAAHAEEAIIYERPHKGGA